MKIKRLTPPQTITVSFAAVIAVGAALLALPAASANGRSVGMLNALFTSTSATCVTGLTVVVTAEHWSVFGKIVLLFLIQIGALGLLTFGALALIIFRHRISLKNQLVIQASFNQERVGGMSKLVSNVVKITLTFELCGTVLLFAAFAVSGMPLGEVLAQGLFHSVSAFCNAGFDNLGSDGLMPYRDNLFVCGVISLLTISGGLGFPVWAELFALRKPESRSSARLKIQHLTLHTKMTLTVTGILIVFGTLLVLLFEWSNPDTLARIHL
ncbi:MAG: hypothetical protein LBT44_00485, partial [Clostridiales bacterium]|nr:hypothetical protein [Clostridiales bacterium]